MNKIVVHVFCLSFLFLQLPTHAESQDQIVGDAREYSELDDTSCSDTDLETNDFEDFFNADVVQSRSVQREKKEPLSRTKVMLIQLGIKAALLGESAYFFLQSWWLWFVDCFGSAQVKDEQEEHQEQKKKAN